MIERRSGRRILLYIPVLLRFGDGTRDWGFAMNINRKGLFVKTSARPWRTGCADMRMTAPMPAGDRTVLIPGLIVHQTKVGFGLMFREFDQRAEEVVSWLLSADELPAQYRDARILPAAASRPSSVYA